MKNSKAARGAVLGGTALGAVLLAAAPAAAAPGPLPAHATPVPAPGPTGGTPARPQIMPAPTHDQPTHDQPTRNQPAPRQNGLAQNGLAQNGLGQSGQMLGPIAPSFGRPAPAAGKAAPASGHNIPPVRSPALPGGDGHATPAHTTSARGVLTRTASVQVVPGRTSPGRVVSARASGVRGVDTPGLFRGVAAVHGRSALGSGHRVAGKVELSYSAPKVAQAGSTVSWEWTVRNTGDKAVSDIVLVHKLTPQLKVTKVAQECKALQTEVRCSYGSLQAGATATGQLVADIPSSATGTVQINGKATWQQGQGQGQGQAQVQGKAQTGGAVAPRQSGGAAAPRQGGGAAAPRQSGASAPNGVSWASGASAQKSPAVPSGMSASGGSAAPSAGSSSNGAGAARQ
ncbi:hypothetical protein AB0J52_20730 [Spirillospora sp. NPDC049652]